MQIYNSYLVKSRKEMQQVLNQYKMKYPDLSIWKRSNFSLLNEWCAHNLLYKMNIYPERTKHVDLDNENLLRRICYMILSGIYVILY